jgi:hypothetical protein
LSSIFIKKVQKSFLGILFIFSIIFPVYGQNSKPQSETKNQTSISDTNTSEYESINADALYMDEETGQVFTKPGSGRKRIVGLGKKGETNLPAHSAHRPMETEKEKLTIYGRIQFRGISGSTDSAFSNGHRDFNSMDYNIRRLRLGALYEGSNWWGAAINIRGENLLNRPQLTSATTTPITTTNNGVTTTTNVVTNQGTLSQNRGAIQEAVGYVNIPWSGSRITFGQINVPFNREYMGSSQNLINIERSMITNVMPQFDIGIMYSFLPLSAYKKEWERYIQGYFFVGNGQGGGGDFGSGRKQDLTYTQGGNRSKVYTSPTFVYRLVYNVFGGKILENGKSVNWQEGEEIFQKDIKWSIGIGVTQTEHVNFSQTTPLSSGTVDAYPRGLANTNLVLSEYTIDQNRGLWYGSDLNFNNTVNNIALNSAGRPKLGLVGHTYDTTFSWNGIYINGAYTKFSGAASNNTQGHHLTMGYSIPVLEKYYIMPVVRYDSIQGDWNRNNKIDGSEIIKSYWLGLNLLGDKHLAKLQIFYQLFHTNMAIDPYTGFPANLDTRMIYIQAQISFNTGTVSPENYRTGN